MSQDFSGQNLRGRSFKGQNLEGANFSTVDIRGTNFTGANLTGANFSYAQAGRQKRSVLVREPSQPIRIPLMAIVRDSLFAKLGNVVWQWNECECETG